METRVGWHLCPGPGLQCPPPAWATLWELGPGSDIEPRLLLLLISGSPACWSPVSSVNSPCSSGLRRACRMLPGAAGSLRPVERAVAHTRSCSGRGRRWRGAGMLPPPGPRGVRRVQPSVLGNGGSWDWNHRPVSHLLTGGCDAPDQERESEHN